MTMKAFLLVLFGAVTVPTTAFVPVTIHRPSLALQSTAKEQHFQHMEELAHKLRLRVFDVDAGVYGLESKDRFYGVQNTRTRVAINPTNHSLGLELTEFAHSNLSGDHRGLVLVSKVQEELSVKDSPIHVGDTLVGVFAGEDFKESVTAMDYDDTVEVIGRAKEHALANGIDTIEFELNRVVKRYHVNVEVEDENGRVTLVEDVLAGDNLGLLLLKHKASLYDGSVPRLDQPFLTGDCGGEGICGICLVQVLKGMDHLNSPGPQEQSILKGRPSKLRAACKTVVGADNVPGTTLLVRLHPHQYQEPLEEEFLRP